MCYECLEVVLHRKKLKFKLSELCHNNYIFYVECKEEPHFCNGYSHKEIYAYGFIKKTAWLNL